jgi:tRNA modification GTPase
VVERLGIETSSRYLARAAIVLACGDDAESRATVTRAVRTCSRAPLITVATKSDAASGGRGDADVSVSAHTGAGLRDLLTLVEHRLSEAHGEPQLDAPGLTRARHQAAVALAAAELSTFATVWRDDVLPASVAALHVRAAADALGDLIGVVQVDDVLDAVFRRFCVGK